MKTPIVSKVPVVDIASEILTRNGDIAFGIIDGDPICSVRWNEATPSQVRDLFLFHRQLARKRCEAIERFVDLMESRGWKAFCSVGQSAKVNPQDPEARR